MPTNYLILRTNVDVQDKINLATPRTWREGTSGLSDLSIETFDGHEHDAGELRRDPRNAAVMDADMMFSLIEPKEQDMSDMTRLQTAGAIRMTEGLFAVKADTSPFTGQGVTVAVLDTGIDSTHPAFEGKQLVTRDFTGGNDASDHNGHGTHCAGTVCGTVVGDIRVGVAPGVTKLCAGKVLGANGGTLEMLLKGMMWAVFEEKASVVSMSLGYDLPGNAKRLIDQFGLDERLAAQQAMNQQRDIIDGISKLRAFLESQNNNIVFSAATGNESQRPSFLLDASLPSAELFSVGAVGLVGQNWRVAPFSNARAQVVAPGVDVISAAPGGGWATMSGTSMATPHVAGVAALWVEKLRNQGALNVPGILLSELKANATMQPLGDRDVNSIGVGMIQCPV